MKALFAIPFLFALTSTALAAAPTEWHASCRVANSPAKDITVKSGTAEVVYETADYVYSVELRPLSLTLRADAVHPPKDKQDTVNYAFVQFKNELPSTVVLTSRLANVFVCNEL